MANAITSRCCIVGGGPAGVMLGFLLARAGADVVVLEKHADFFRDFRGDTIHPSTLEFMHELGLLEEFLRLPHTEVSQLTGSISGVTVTIADFRYLPTTCKFIALMPQWDFLNFVATQGKRYPGFRLMMQTEATDLIKDGERVVGVRAMAPDGPCEIRADLVIGADGRHSVVRVKAGFQVRDLGAPMDVFWMRITRRPEDGYQALGRISRGHVSVMLDRGDYWQCALVIPKGSAEEVRNQGLPAFRALVARLAPALTDRVGELKDWDAVKLLTVAVERLDTWYKPGVLCIGDAAHAMSPIGGVGINLAVQDAVGAANILWRPLREGTVGEADLAAVQARREWPMKVIQRLQIAVQNTVIGPALTGKEDLRPPFAVKLLNQFPWLRRFPARLVGLGVRPEHIHSPEVH